MTDLAAGYTPAQSYPEAPKSELPPRLIKGLHADYEPARMPVDAETGEFVNTSGLVPYGPNVLIQTDTCSQLTAGGIMLADDMIERMNMAAESGCIFAIGVTAFKGYGEGKPKVGDRVYFHKYSGIQARGRDGGYYRVMDENVIAAGLSDPDATEQPHSVGI